MQNTDSENAVFLIRYESLYRNYKKILIQDADKILEDDQLAEDAFQQTFLRLFMYKDCLLKLRHGQERNYLKAVISNVCYEMLKHQKATSVCDVLSPSWEEYCVRSAEDEYMSGQLKVMLEEMPEKYGTPLKLHFLDRFSYEEIGEIYGEGPATVRKRAERGRKMLATQMEETD